MSDLADMTATQMAAAIRSKTVSPVEVTEAVLRRIEACKVLNAFITVTGERALAEACAAEDKVMQGGELPPLHGVPYSVKDLLNTAGVRTTMGSRLFENNVPATNAVSAARARAAGAILVGKTTTPEFGHLQAATSPLFGRTLNPIDSNVTPGASSSGSAVAVAAGMGPISLGTDGGGSSRIPAACCGVVGFKPSLGAIPHLQLPDLFGANSYVGPLARTVADVALVFDAISGPDFHDTYGQAAKLLHEGGGSLAGLRVGFIAEGGARVERETAAITAAAVRKLEDAGAIVEEAFIDFKSYEPVFLTILRVGLAARTGPLITGREELVGQTLIDTIALGHGYSAVDLSNAVSERTRLFREFQALFERFDILVSPTLTAPPLSIEVDPTGDIEVDGVKCGTVRGAWYPFTFPHNLSGHPAITIPCGSTAAGLPLGLQLCAPWYHDRMLLKVAADAEDLLGDGDSPVNGTILGGTTLGREMKQSYDIAVVHGDGIGPEVCAAAIEVLDAALGGSDVLRFAEHPACADHFLRTGDSFPETTFEACRDADAILHGAGGIPGVVHPDGTEAGLDFTLQLRSRLDLYANIRPIRLLEGVASPLVGVKANEIDYIILRENSEGLYAARGAGSQLRGEVAVDTLVQTRHGIERICRKAFELARLSAGAPRDGVKRVTCCDKANVLRSYAFFRSVFDSVAEHYRDIETEHVLIDAMTMHLIMKPGHYNVIVTENMFGDIISDLAAATIGGMGMAPSAELGDSNGFFQAAHGSAPDIAGKGIANPYGTILSAATMLEWLGQRHVDQRLVKAASSISEACNRCLSRGLLSADIKGQSSTTDITRAVCEEASRLNALDV